MTHHSAASRSTDPVVVAVVCTVLGVLCALGVAVGLSAGWFGPGPEEEEGVPALAESESVSPVLSTTTVISSDMPPIPPSSTEEHTTVDAAPAGDAAAILQSAVNAAVAAYGGTAGVAVSDGSTATAAGDDGAYPAWSTIKVPLAIAALRADPGQYGNAQAAITVSDNAAAQALHDSLAPGAADAVLVEGGAGVALNMVKTRAEFTTFGQTLWSASQEATFAANLPCIAGAGEVLDLMGQIAPDQAYGLGQLPGAQFKGGWGPDPSGLYHVRQLGRVPVTGGAVAFGLTVQPASGSYGDAQAMMNIIAEQLRPHLEELPVAACGANGG